MGWKNWSYWIRGGVILSMLYVLFGIFLLILFYITDYVVITFLIIYPLAFLSSNFVINTLFTFLENISGGSGGFAYIVIFIINLILIFLIGALIGLIVGKVKNRKNKIVETKK